MASAIFAVVLGLVAFAVSGPLPIWLGGSEEIHHDSSIYFGIFALCMPFMMMRSIASGMLKCAGNMRIPSILSVLMCVLDVIFNYIGIFVLHLGVVGAALGTALSFIIIGVWMMWFSVYRSSELSLNKEPGSWRFRGEYIRNAIKIGSPMAAQNVLMSGAQIVSTMIVAPLGMMSIAANSFAITAESICYMPGYGISSAATTLVGQSIGAKRKDLARSFSWLTTFTGVAIMSMAGLVMYFLCPSVFAFLTPDPEVQKLGVEVLRIELLAEPLFAASIVATGCLRGAGDTLIPGLLNLISIWGVRLTLGWYLARSMGLRGMWIAMAVELSVRGILFLIRLKKEKWLKDPK